MSESYALVATLNHFACLSIEEIPDNESDYLSDWENEHLAIPPISIPPRPLRQCILKWECHLPSHYVLAVTPDVNLFNIDTQIQTTDTGAVHSQPSLLNLGATDLFINMSYTNEKHITM
jgi:hypothetical protein